MNNETMSLKIALQKSGKLSEGCIELLNKCGFNLKPSKIHYLIKSQELNTDFLMVRDDDIPGFIDGGVSDIGIIGENLLEEYLASGSNKNLEVLVKLKFAHCRLSIAVPKDGTINKLADLQGKTIATSYPATLKKFLEKQGIEANIVIMHGSVEVAPKIGIANAICDIVSSGATLKENGLTEMQVIMHSEAVLIANKNINLKIRKRVEELIFRFQSVIDAKDSKYIMLHIAKAAIDQLKNVLPGCETPTVLNLHGSENKVAVHVVSREAVFWDTISKLKNIGATSILVIPIEKMMN